MDFVIKQDQHNRIQLLFEKTVYYAHRFLEERAHHAMKPHRKHRCGQEIEGVGKGGQESWFPKQEWTGLGQANLNNISRF